MSTFSPCEICVEKKCPTDGKCNCESCAVKATCPKYNGLNATVRITKKCTQKCSHCCFSCSPLSEDMMTVETAKNIAVFIKKNGVKRLNIMGGEIFCNPNYKEILSVLIPAVKNARLVTNSDWVEHDKSFAKFITKFKNVYLSLSKDEYHTNKHVDEAEKILKGRNVRYTIDSKGVVNSSSIVPVGRAQFGLSNFYSFMGCYCHNPEHHYSFLIDEVGEIYKCGFGIWNYANINDYLEGGFRDRFKEFNTKFYGIFISSCTSCIRGFNSK